VPLRRGTYWIVVASGEAIERESWTALLSRPEYTITQVVDGEKALRLMKTDQADLVIAAVTMSTMDALELLRTVRPMKDAPPVIVIARGRGEIDDLYLKTAALLGAAETYMQPLEPSTFLAGVRTALQFRRIRPADK